MRRNGERSCPPPSVIALVVTLLAGACMPATEPLPTGVEVPEPGGRIVEGVPGDIATLQPILANDQSSNRVASKIYEQLTEVNPQTGEIEPNLGRWTMTPDGRTFVWQIEPNAKWSDGTPITGIDYLTTVKSVARSKKTIRRSNFQDIEGFTAYADGKATSIVGITVDGKRFSVTFNKVFCPSLASTFSGNPAALLPAQVFAKYTVDDDPSRNLDDAPENILPTVSSGPFLFKEWRRGDQVILDRNPSYWKGPPFVEHYVQKTVSDATAVASGLKTGELNYGTIQSRELADIENQKQLQVFRYPQPGYNYIGWNVRSQSAPALQDRRVRQALAYGLDIDAVVKAVFFGQAKKVVAHSPSTSWAYTPNLNPYAYDRSKAEELIRSAGYAKGADGIYQKEGRALAFSILANATNRNVASLVQIAVEQYGQIGVRVTPRLEASATVNERLLAGDPTIESWTSGWGLSGDPDPYSIWHSSQIPDPSKNRQGFNFGGFTAAGVDEAIEKGRNGPDCSRATRAASYQTFNRILNEEQPYNFGFAPNTIVVTNRNLHIVNPGTFNDVPSIQLWWLHS